MSKLPSKNVLWTVGIIAAGLLTGGYTAHLLVDTPGPTLILDLIAGGAIAGSITLFAPFGAIGRAAARDRARQLHKKEDEERSQFSTDLRICQEMIRKLEAQMNRVPKSAQENVRESVKFCSLIYQAISSDTNKKKAIKPFIKDHLIPMEETVGTYLRLTERKLTIADEALKNAEEKILPGIAKNLETFYNNIHLGDITRLATAEAQVGVKATLGAEAELGM